MRRSLLPTLLIAQTALLGACASSGKTYPSLEIREAERVSRTFEVAQSIEAAPLRTSFVEDISVIENDAREAHAAFMAAGPEARTRVSAAQGAQIASDRWAFAQVALADLDSLRSRTAVSLGDLDLIYADATLAFEKREAIAATRTLVIGFIREEDTLLSELRGQITK